MAAADVHLKAQGKPVHGYDGGRFVDTKDTLFVNEAKEIMDPGRPFQSTSSIDI